MIKIKMEKIIDRGNQMVKILEIEMLNYSQLPWNYTEIGESVCLYANSDNIHVEYYQDFNRHYDSYWLKVGEEYSPKTIKERIEIIRRCGKRLQEINRLLNIENAGWSGTETIII